MYKIESYKIAWNTKSDEGIFIVHTPNGLEQIFVDSAAEARMLLTQLRQEGNAYIHQGLIITSDEALDIPPPVVPPVEPVGEVEFIPHQVSWVIEKKPKITPEPVIITPKPAPVITPKAKAKVTPKKKRPTKAKQKPTKATKDKLRLVEGIGPKIESLLHEAGILSFQDLADAKQNTLKKILEAAGSRYRMHDPTTWSEQAAMAAAGKLKELKKWQDELKGGKVSK